MVVREDVGATRLHKPAHVAQRLVHGLIHLLDGQVDETGCQPEQHQHEPVQAFLLPGSGLLFPLQLRHVAKHQQQAILAVHLDALGAVANVDLITIGPGAAARHLTYVGARFQRLKQLLPERG